MTTHTTKQTSRLLAKLLKTVKYINPYNGREETVKAGRVFDVCDSLEYDRSVIIERNGVLVSHFWSAPPGDYALLKEITTTNTRSTTRRVPLKS